MVERLRGLLVNVLLAATVSIAFLAVLEMGARAFEHRRPAPQVADYLWDWQKKWEGDFYTIRSDSTGWPPWEDFNADGFRDRAHAKEKPEGVTRIVFLGDSVTLGDQIKPAEAFPQQLQQRFDAERRPVE